MKIRTALTLKNTCVTATIFLLCMVLIYLVSEHTRDQTFVCTQLMLGIFYKIII